MGVADCPNCLHPTDNFTAASDVRCVQGKFVMAGAVRVRIAAKPEAKFVC
jgi:hypothetical protein